MHERKAATSFIFITLLLDVIGFGLLIPIGPTLVKTLMGPEAAADDVSIRYSQLTVTYALMQFIFAPILGSLSDRFGRRPLILISLLGAGLDYFAQAIAPTLWLLFLTRAINGISGSNISVCNAYVADVTPPEKRAGAYGLIGAAFGLGFIIGPLLGAAIFAMGTHYGERASQMPEWFRPAAEWAGEHAVRLPFIAAGLLCMVNWLYGCFVLPESLRPENRRPFSLARSNPFGTFRHLLRYPLVLGLAGAFFLLYVAQYSLHVTWAVYTEHRYGWKPWEIAASLTTVGIGAAIVQGGLARKLIPLLGEGRSVLIGIAIGVCAFTAYGLASQGWMIYVIASLASLGGIAQPACQAIITRSVPANEQGEVQGALTSMQAVAGVCGMFAGGMVQGYFIGKDAPVYIPGAAYFMSAGLSILGLLASWHVLRRFAASL